MKTLAPAVVATAAVTLLASCATDYDNVAYDPGGSTHFFSLSNRNNDRGYDCRNYNYDGRYCDGFH
jgi:hypothetical protein